ncbi:hypothetical protein ScPMuIL_010468 [Solemya velum]
MKKVFGYSVVTLIFVFHSVLSSDLQYEIFENENPNYYVGNIASDIELWTSVPSEEFQSLTYSFLTQGNTHFSSYFKIDSKKSIMRTASKLDREVLCEYDLSCVLPLEVAVQSSVGVFFRRIKIEVILKDVNDHAPVFDKRSVNLELSESSVVGTILTLDGAVDKDIGNNSVQSYNLLPETSPFTVQFTKYMDGRSVVGLVVAEELNREMEDTYSFQVIATDGGDPPKSDSLNVVVTITDYNDNPPTFLLPSYEVTVKEDTPKGSVIITLSATDADIDMNGEIDYALSIHQSGETKSLFAINRTTGEVRVIGDLMYKSTKNYRIIVEASDRADNPLMSQTEVLVKVLDSNNNAPNISIDIFKNGQISEYANIGAVVALVRVLDADSGINGRAKCQISSNKFSLQYLDMNEYKVTVSESLNREIADTHQVEIFCYDLGIPSLNHTKRFMVTVLDENDNAPRFYQQNYHVRISENNEINAPLLKVQATDYDLAGSKNAEIIYFLDIPTLHDLHIDSSTGLVTVGSVLDRESISDSKFEFKVFAHDDGSPTSLTGSAMVYVTVLDINDKAPEFQNTSYLLEIAENSENFTVGSVFAKDFDAGQNGTVSYFMSPDSITSVPFEIKQNGRVQTLSKLDREFRDLYHFVIVARDHGKIPLSSSVNVTVRILDKNDHRPQFVFPVTSNNTVIVSYHVPVRTIVAKLHAIDKDIGNNGQIFYSIQNQNFTDMFHLDPHSGEISVVRKLDSSDVQTCRFNVTVRDNGDESLRTSQVLEIKIMASDIFIPKPTDESKQNILIVISIVCVTLVLSAAIILIICMIRCVDRKNKKYGCPNKKNSPDTEALDQKNRLREKKVSFFFGSNSTNQPPKDEHGKEDNFNIQIREMNSDQMGKPQNEGVLYLGRNESSSQGKDMTVTCDNSNPTNQLSALKLHQSILDSHEQMWLNHSSELPLTKDFMKRLDDSHSESSGETTTSDSGRGGSEDEVTSNGGHSHSRDSDLMKQIQNANTIAQLLHKSCPHQPQWRNSERFSKSRADTHEITKSRYHSTSTINSVNPCSSKREMFSVYSPIRSTAPKNLWNSQVDYLDTSLCTYDDDDGTTTSGSYTIDPEDLCTEIPIPRDCIV